MTALKIIAGLAFLAAGLLLIMAMSDERPLLLVPSMSGAIAGFLFLALDRIVTLLAQIREALTISSSPSDPQTASSAPPVDLAPDALAKLEERLQKAKS